MSRARKLLRTTAGLGAAFLFAALIAVFGTGDFGLTQYVLNGMEARALKQESSVLDKLALKGAYQTILLSSSDRYPLAAEMLRHYCAGSGDTLFFDAQTLLRNPEVQTALRTRKRAIAFRAQQVKNEEYYAVTKTDWPLYYAFDLLFIKTKPGKIIFYDDYSFQLVKRKSRTPFQVGKVKFRLNDGLIHVAYPTAKAFVAYAEAD